MIINEELNRKINVAKKIFYENFELNDEFHFEVYLCKDKDELYEKRLLMTRDPFMNKVLKTNPEKYAANGCWIYPVINDSFNILLTSNEELIDIVVYNFLHEFVHIYNYLEVGEKDYYDGLFNVDFNNCDEFLARYESTKMFYFNYLEWEKNEKYYKELLNLAAELQKDIKQDECVDLEKVSRYNLMQYLGFVYAIEQSYRDYFEMPQFIIQNEKVFDLYSKLTTELELN